MNKSSNKKEEMQPDFMLIKHKKGFIFFSKKVPKAKIIFIDLTIVNNQLDLIKQIKSNQVSLTKPFVNFKSIVQKLINTFK